MKRAMAKPKTHYYCAECGADYRKWAGQCAECGAWNTLVEQVVQPGQVDPSTASRFDGFAPTSEVRQLAEVDVSTVTRLSGGSGELDRVLGGGLVRGSTVYMSCY